MNRSLRRFALFASGTVLLSFVVLVVNQTAQVVQLATTVDPTLGKVTLFGLLATYAGLIGVPVVMIARLPAPLRAPRTDAGPEFEAHLKKLGARIGTSPHVVGCDLSRRDGIEEALGRLSRQSDLIVREAATSVFLATAVSQSGRLDALLVLLAQSRMVWKLAHLYNQRPGLRDMTTLYANVAGTAFLAGEVQDLDLGEQVEPIVGAAIGALGANLPGLKGIGSLLAGCVLDGSANAFLTLRVGMIAKRYCAALVVEPKPSVRRAATAEAVQHLSSIVSDGSAKLTRAITSRLVGKMGEAVSGATVKARGAFSRFGSIVRGGSFREQPEMS